MDLIEALRRRIDEYKGQMSEFLLALILFPISSDTPQENPAALLARFEVVSISLNDFI